MDKQIEVPSRRFGYFPYLINIDGREITVKCVERCWTTGNKKMSRHYFDVTTSDGRFTVYQDLKTFQWYVTP